VLSFLYVTRVRVFFVQFMAFLILIFLGEIVGGVLAIVFKDSVSYTLCTDI